MISANNVTLRVGKKALFEEVNIKFTEGNCYGLIGANGAGKSTFLKILSGQLEPTNGEVAITPGERLSFLQQDHFKYDEYPVLDTVIMGNARLYEIMKEKEASKRSHIPFSDNELNILWENVGKVKYIDWILIQCYMGWRPQELALLRLDEINLEEWYMQAGIKTDAGKQRIVPIHTRIRDLVKQNYDIAMSLGSPYLFNDKGQTHAGSYKITYDKYSYRFKAVMAALNLNPEHRPHDPRNTFVTRAKKAEVDEYALKEMVGHKIQDITESVYTLRDLEWLRSDLEKIR
mgnify:CR=1 FL=1